MSYNHPIEQLGATATERPYLPFPSAISHNLISPSEDQVRAQGGNPPGVDIANGYIPNTSSGGLIQLKNNEFAAFDHTSATFEDGGLRIHPTEKNDVSHDGMFQGEGVITLSSSEGRVKVAAFVIDMVRNPWQIESFRRGSYFKNRVGNLAIISAAGMDLPNFEITDVDKDGSFFALPQTFRR